MKRRTATSEGTITGSVRVDPRTQNLAKRLRKGEVAVIDHPDLDRASAEALVKARPAAVLNAAKSTTGRYPNPGTGILVDAGVLLVDNLGPDVMTLAEGNRIRIEDGVVYRGDALVAEGTVQTAETVAADQQAAHDALPVQLQSFVSNSANFLARERDLLLDNVGLPDLRTNFAGKHVVVVGGGGRAADLRQLRGYLKDEHPVLIGVGPGADTLLAAGFKPDIVVADTSVSDKALASGAELVVHASRDGHAPGRERVEALGLPAVVFSAGGTSEDVAMLLADAKGAELIVAVGATAGLIDVVDAGTPSTFLTRVRVGGKLVDASAVARLYNNRIATWQLLLLVLAGLAALAVALAVTPAGQSLFALAGAWFGGVWSGLVGLFS